MVATSATQRALVGRQAQAALERELSAAGEESAEAAAEPVQILRLDAVVGDPLRPQQLAVELGPCIGFRAAGTATEEIGRSPGGAFAEVSSTSMSPDGRRSIAACKLLSAINET